MIKNKLERTLFHRTHSAFVLGSASTIYDVTEFAAAQCKKPDSATQGQLLLVWSNQGRWDGLVVQHEYRWEML